jgi:hypothetical protein
MLRPVALVVVALILVGCASGVPSQAAPSLGTSNPPSTTAVESARPSANPTTAATNEASIPPSDEPSSSPAPPGAADIKVVREVLKKWKSAYSSYVDAQIIVEVKNVGGGWAELLPGESDYTIYAKDGTVSQTGSFLYPYPRYLAPGATGYFLDGVVFSDEKVANLVRLESNVYFWITGQCEVVRSGFAGYVAKFLPASVALASP